MSWSKLLETALKILDNGKIKDDVWSLGGGTALMLRYKHRKSKDIDIFFNDPQLLAYISPRTSDIADIISYNEQSIFTKLRFQLGEIDFIVSPKLTNCENSIMKFNSRQIFIEHPVEILAKKLVYRASDFKIRDIYDFSIVSMQEKSNIIKHKDIFLSKYNELTERINKLRKSGMSDEIIPYDNKSQPIDINVHINNILQLMKELTLKKLKSKDRGIEM
jgi:hypothetical protein